jgi:prophage tail gpP-like protein
MNLQCRSATRDAIDSDWSKHFYFPSPTFQTIQRYTGTQEIYIFPQKTLRSVNIKKGQKIFEAFAKLASDTDGLWAIPTPNGQVEFVKLPSNRDPVASLKEGESPVMNVSTEFDLSKRFKDYIGIGVRAGQGSNVKITDKEIEDLGIQGRVKFVKASNEDANLREAVKRNMSLDLIESFTCVVNLSQWDIEGKLWQPGVLLELQAPANFIFKPYKFAVRKVSFRLDDSNGESCDLTLTLPNAFDNTPPTEVPWQLPSKQELNLLDQAKAFIGF